MLSYVGSFYMVFLIILLIIGLGSVGLSLVNYIFAFSNKNNMKLKK